MRMIAELDKTWKKSVVTWFNHFKPEVHLNNIEEFSPYIIENTTILHYKDQLVNAV
jgi:hypothetical protein